MPEEETYVCLMAGPVVRRKTKWKRTTLPPRKHTHTHPLAHTHTHTHTWVWNATSKHMQYIFTKCKGVATGWGAVGQA